MLRSGHILCDESIRFCTSVVNLSRPFCRCVFFTQVSQHHQAVLPESGRRGCDVRHHGRAELHGRQAVADQRQSKRAGCWLGSPSLFQSHVAEFSCFFCWNKLEGQSFSPLCPQESANEEIPIMLLGNKTDKEMERKVEKKMGERLAKVCFSAVTWVSVVRGAERWHYFSFSVKNHRNFSHPVSSLNCPKRTVSWASLNAAPTPEKTSWNPWFIWPGEKITWLRPFWCLLKNNWGRFCTQSVFDTLMFPLSVQISFIK